MSIYKCVEIWDTDHVRDYLGGVSRHALLEAFMFDSCILCDPTRRSLPISEIRPRDLQWLEGLIRYDERPLEVPFEVPVVEGAPELDELDALFGPEPQPVQVEWVVLDDMPDIGE